MDNKLTPDDRLLLIGLRSKAMAKSCKFLIRRLEEEALMEEKTACITLATGIMLDARDTVSDVEDMLNIEGEI